MKKQVHIALIMCSVAVVVWTLSSEQNRRALLFSEGHTVRNGHGLLGARVGDTAETAQTALSGRGLRRNTQIINAGDDLVACYPDQPEGQPIALFRETGWRRGSVCLTLVDGRVSRIDWRYNLLSP